MTLILISSASHPAAEHVKEGPRGHLQHDDHYQDADELAETETESTEQRGQLIPTSPDHLYPQWIFIISFIALEVLESTISGFQIGQRTRPRSQFFLKIFCWSLVTREHGNLFFRPFLVKSLETIKPI